MSKSRYGSNPVLPIHLPKPKFLLYQSTSAGYESRLAHPLPCLLYTSQPPSATPHHATLNNRILNTEDVYKRQDAISVKRGELLRIKKLLQSRLGTSDTATRYHYEDMILRINTALGLSLIHIFLHRYPATTGTMTYRYLLPKQLLLQSDSKLIDVYKRQNLPCCKLLPDN